MHSKSVELLHLTLLILCLMEVGPTLHVVLIDSDHLLLAGRELAVLPVDGLFLGAVAAALEHLLHPLHSGELPLVVGHEVASVAHGVVEVSLGSDASLELLLADEGISVLGFHIKINYSLDGRLGVR